MASVHDQVNCQRNASRTFVRDALKFEGALPLAAYKIQYIIARQA